MATIPGLVRKLHVYAFAREFPDASRTAVETVAECSVENESGREGPKVAVAPEQEYDPVTVREAASFTVNVAAFTVAQSTSRLKVAETDAVTSTPV
jgi:hypothetical protein